MIAHPADIGGGLRPSRGGQRGTTSGRATRLRRGHMATSVDVISITDQLAPAFRGALVHPEHEDFDAARLVWNGMFDRRPALVARCFGAADVIAAVNFARENSMAVAVRGGGHSASGYGTCDGGLVIDLSLMKGIRVDPRAGTVRAEAGLTWGEFD